MNEIKFSKQMGGSDRAAVDVHLEAFSREGHPFASRAVASAARGLAHQATLDAGLRPWESGGGKASMLSDEVAKLVEMARTHRKVNMGSLAAPSPARPWYRRFDKR